MDYSTPLIQTVAECNVLVTFGQAEAKAATYQVNLLTHSQENAAANASEYAEELDGLNEDIDSLTSRLPGMTDGAYKVKKTNELRKSIDRRDELVSRQQREGVVALIKRQLALKQAQDALASANELIAAVQARKAELEA